MAGEGVGAGCQEEWAGRSRGDGWGWGVRRSRVAEGGGPARPRAHLLQLVALLLQLLQGPEAGLLLLREGEDVAVGAGGGGRGK